MRVSTVHIVAAAANAPIVGAAFVDRSVQVWDWNSGRRLAAFDTVCESGGRRFALSGDGNICVAASWKKGKCDGVASYACLRGEKRWHRLDIRRVQGLRFSATSETIWCWIENHPVQRLDANSGETLETLRGVQDVFESAYSEHRLEVCAPGFVIRGSKSFRIPRLSHFLLDAAFSRNGVCLTEAGGPVRCIDCSSGDRRWLFQPASGAHVVAVSYRPTDRSFYAVRRDAHGGPTVLMRLDEESGDSAEVCFLDSAVTSFAADAIITGAGDVISLAAGALLRRLALPERDYPDPPPPVTEPLLLFAARIGTEKTVRNLVESGSDVNVVADDGSTPLHAAVVKGRLEVVRVLLELGADPNLRNASGDTAAQAADRSGHREIAEILRSHSRN